MKNETPKLYDLTCVNNSDKICPVKQAIISEATGDLSGRTQIESELTEQLVQLKFRERNRLATGLAAVCVRDVDLCPTTEIVDNMPIRRGMLKLARGAYHIVSRRNQ